MSSFIEPHSYNKYFTFCGQSLLIAFQIAQFLSKWFIVWKFFFHYREIWFKCSVSATKQAELVKLRRCINASNILLVKNQISVNSNADHYLWICINIHRIIQTERQFHSFCLTCNKYIHRLRQFGSVLATQRCVRSTKWNEKK